MDEEVFNEIKRIMEKVKPFIAIAVLILLCFSVNGLYQNNKIQKEVKESCGYQMDEEVFCICDRDMVAKIKFPQNPYYNESLEEFDFTNSFSGENKLKI